MGLKTLLTVILITVMANLCHAQDSIPNVEQDSIIYDESNEYIHVYKNRITARAFFVSTSNSLTLVDRDTDFSIDLTPNKQDRIGASVAFRFINISYSFAPDFIAKNKDNDDSKLFNLNIRTYFGKHWMQTLDIYKEKGFYVENEDFQEYLPRTKWLKVGGSTSYIFNENFSFRAIASQDEKQLKSVGSFIPSILYYYTDYDIFWDTGDPSNSIDDSSKSFDIALAPAYYYNFVPTRNLFISAGFSAGIGMHYAKDSTTSEITLLTEFNLRTSLTYDIDNLYLGAYYSYLVLNYNSENTVNVSDNIPFFQAFIGYRFKAPKKIVKTADDFNAKFIP
ncbi:DUF4421 domain-containing protein [Formosa haliotis]|uniref:DUF4421 domain-containing protein n=1 Tax=Formosa haliotis TaxID=1555194 RepID=UPI0008265189|nr:DUF4421 domain-containing protein [Formosa haliotis]